MCCIFMASDSYYSKTDVFGAIDDEVRVLPDSVLSGVEALEWRRLFLRSQVACPVLHGPQWLLERSLLATALKIDDLGDFVIIVVEVNVLRWVLPRNVMAGFVVVLPRGVELAGSGVT